MDDKSQENIDSISKEIQAQANILEVDTIHSLILTSDILNRYLDRLTTNHLISRAGMRVLRTLLLNNGRMISVKIGKDTFRSKYTVSRVVNTLEKQGLIKKRADGRDRRSKTVQITVKGIEASKNAIKYAHERINEDVFKALEESEIEDFNRKLKLIRDQILTLMESMDSDTP